MNWAEFAKLIGANLNNKSDNFTGGNTIEKEISKVFNEYELKISKKIRRSYQASSHFNIEKFEFEYKIADVNFGRIRVRRKNFLLRLGKSKETQYLIDGDVSKELKDMLSTKEMKYIFQYPKSEFILLDNTIKLKAQSLGMMEEDLLFDD